MKRQDAFRKIRTICQRLDEVDPDSFYVQPLRLYLFGSVLTDKSNPKDIDPVLIYENSPDYDPETEYVAMVYGEPLSIERAITHLRRNMKMIRMATVLRSLEEWENREFLLNIRPRLTWKPGANWASALDKIEASPLPWPGPRPPDADERHKVFIRSMHEAEYQARLAEALKEIEEQDL